MSETVRLVDYYYIETPDKPGEGLRALDLLRQAGVYLLAYSGFPKGRRSQLDFVPANVPAFKAAARKARWKVTGPKKVFLICGEDRVGVVADLFAQLAEAKVNVTASQAIIAGSDRFGMILWVKPRDVKKAAKALNSV
jgi:predicted amino acid-binding ACT domain protein